MQTQKRRSSFGTRAFALLLCALLLAGPLIRVGGATGATEPAVPPTQPATGPGGAEVAYDGLLAQHFGPQPDGSGEPTGYWLFEPTRPRAQTAAGPLPLVPFLHGYDVPSPEWYHAWLDHLVRRGAIVIYPDYQTAGLPFDQNHLTATDGTAPHAIVQAVRAALIELKGGSHAQADPTRLVVFGHSLGTLLAADYAATAAAQGLPVPAALLLGMPGCMPGCSLAAIPEIPAATRVLVLTGDQDDLDDQDMAKAIWAGLGQVPADHKDYVRLVSDDHGAPALVADHFVPTSTSVQFFALARGGLNAFDWYGTWKFLDALMSCSFAEKDCRYATGNTPEQRSMGTWSDGVPVAEAEVVADPGPPTSWPAP
jgi:acetyl esterase/lipase